MNFYDLDRDELAAYLKDRFGASDYRSVQLFEWVYGKQMTDVGCMTDISRELREVLSTDLEFPAALIKRRDISTDGTRKYLFEVAPDKIVESVMIKQPTRMTLCVSSQVGCGMGCKFCRTGTMGFISNLSSAQIMAQVLGVIEDAKNFDDRFSNIVFMGMGEPLHNLEQVARAVRILTDDRGLRIAPRRITVSTVGLVPAIRKFAAMELDVNLAVSLNATTDEVRRRIMPVSKAWPLAELISCLKEIPRRPRKKITIEYVMLSGINDTPQDLKRLPGLLRGVPCKVNLIPYNENAGLGFRSPPKERVVAWQNTLTTIGVDTTIRWSKGQDINAACGQLMVSDAPVAQANSASL